MRFQDGLQDFYHFVWDAGPVFYLSERIEVPLVLRLEERKAGSQWRRQETLLIDPKVTFYQSPGWKFDLRNRLQVQVSDPELLYLRILPKATRSFHWNRHKIDYFIGNDFYVILSKYLRRQHTRCNYFITGFSFSLNATTDLEPCYKLFSMRNGAGESWRHYHQSCIALSLKL